MGKIMLNGISYGGGGGGTTGDYLNKVDPEGSGTMILNLESTSSRPGTSTRNVIFGNHNISTGTNLNDSMIQGLGHNITATGGYHHIEGHNNTLSASGYGTHIEGDSNGYMGSGNYNHIEGHSHVLSGPGDENHLGGASCTLAGGDLLQNFIQGAYNNITGSRFRNVTILGNNNANNGTSMDRSTIIGSYNRVFSPGSSIDDTVIIGQSSTAHSGFNVNLGYFNKSAGTNAFLFGSSNSINTTANQSNNIIIGVTNYISASTSDKNMIFGYNNYITGNKAEYNTVIGSNTTATYNSRYNTILGYASKFNGTTGSDKNVILGSFNEINDNSVSRVSGSIIGGYMSTISANDTGNGVIEGGSVFGRSMKLISSAADGSLMYGPFITGYWSNVTLKGFQYGGLYNLAFMDPVIGHNQGGIVSGYYSTVNVANIKGSIIGGLGMKATCGTLEGAFVYGSASTVDSNSYMYGTWIGGENINYSSTVSPYGGIIHGNMTTVKDSNIYGGIIAGESNKLENGDIEGGLLVGRANELTGEVESVIVGGFWSTVSDSKYALVSGHRNNVTSASYSVVGGRNLIANAENQTIFGKFNATPTTATAFAIGNGTTTDARSNALTVNWDGSAELANDLTVHYGGTAFNVGQCLSTASGGGGGSSVNYSTTEQIVGKWIDGTTDVYEITIYDSTINITAQTSQVIANIPNIDIVVSADGCILESGGTTPIGNAVGLWVNNSDVYILTEGNRTYAGSAYITLRYTKSTT